MRLGEASYKRVAEKCIAQHVVRINCKNDLPSNISNHDSEHSLL